MLLENQIQQIDDLPENTIKKIVCIKNYKSIYFKTTFNGPPGVCEQ